MLTLWQLEELLGPTGGEFCVVVMVGACLDAVRGCQGVSGHWDELVGTSLAPTSSLSPSFSTTFSFLSLPFPPFFFLNPPFFVLLLPWHAFSQWSDVPEPCISYNNPGLGLLIWLQVQCWFRVVRGETLTRLLWGDTLPCCRLKCTVVTATHTRGVAPCV